RAGAQADGGRLRVHLVGHAALPGRAVAARPLDRARNRRAQEEDRSGVRARRSQRRPVVFSGTPSAAHFVYIPCVLIIGIVLGWFLGGRAARDYFESEKRKQEDRERRQAERAARDQK